MNRAPPLGRDLRSELDRYNLFLFVNHEFENGTEAYTELSYYQADTNLIRHPSTMTTGVELVVVAARTATGDLTVRATGDHSLDVVTEASDRFQRIVRRRVVETEQDEEGECRGGIKPKALGRPKYVDKRHNQTRQKVRKGTG